MPADIRITGVTCRFGERTVLDGVTLALTERRIGIVGRNGSGKSTLVRTLCGLIAPEHGQVLINGVDVLKDRKAAIATVGMIFQNPDHQIIFPTVEEEIAFGLRQQGRGKADALALAHETLAHFQRSDWAKRSVSTLSQGQRHLVCLMSVLAMKPAVILLDEPFSGLDIPTTRALQRYLAQVEATVIHVTHDRSLIGDYDRVLWIDGGKVAGDGAPDDVLPAYVTAMEAADAGADL